MGTRSLTYVYNTYQNENGQDVDEPVVCMYRQFDGYPSGHGAELAEFLLPFRFINGISGEVKIGRFANGMGCIAAQMISAFKTEVGGIYLHQPILGRDDWQEYEYHVFENRVVIYSGQYQDGNIAFDGDYEQFAGFCSEEQIA